MPTEEYLGAIVTAHIPNDSRLVALGYTDVRFYFADAEDGPYTLESSSALVAGQKIYSYNKADAEITDWWYWAPYGATPGEGPQSEPQPVGPAVSTRKMIRQGVGRRLRLMELAQVTTSVDTDTVVCASLIDQDASPAKYANHYARASAGNVSGETRRVRTIANSGYVPATGTLNVSRPFSLVPNTATVLELWRPVRDEDPSVLVDEAINRARRSVWWEEPFYFTASANVTEYMGPAFMVPGSIQSVEYANDTYPNSPDWRPVGDWQLTMDGGQPLLTVSASTFAAVSYSDGTVLRVRYNRFGDRLDSDTDYWLAPLDWAVAEAALAFLSLILTPGGGKEDVSDASVAAQELQREVSEWRRIYMPQARMSTRLPR